MEGLNTIQLEILKELIDEALDKAADSMEKMLKIRVQQKDVEFGNGVIGHLDEFEQLGRFKVHLVKVEFTGEIKGAFYFIIKGHEVDLINKVCLPESVNMARSSQNKMMKHDFMLEIENMIAALSITEISEFLGVNLIGGVPVVNVMQGDQINEYLRKENLINKTAFYVKSILAGINVDVKPFFIWALDQNFVEKLKLNIVT